MDGCHTLLDRKETNHGIGIPTNFYLCEWLKLFFRNFLTRFKLGSFFFQLFEFATVSVEKAKNVIKLRLNDNFDQNDKFIIAEIDWSLGQAKSITTLKTFCTTLEARVREEHATSLSQRLAELETVHANLKDAQQKTEEVFSRRMKDIVKRETVLCIKEKECAMMKDTLEQLEKLLKQPKPKKEDEPELFKDMIFTLDVMEEPVIAVDGFTYEKRCILEWFSTKGTSPTTGAVLTSTALIPNHSLKSQINQWKEEQDRRS